MISYEKTFRELFSGIFGPPSKKGVDPEHIAHLERTRDALCEEIQDLLNQAEDATRELDEVLNELKEYTK